MRARTDSPFSCHHAIASASDLSHGDSNTGGIPSVAHERLIVRLVNLGVPALVALLIARYYGSREGEVMVGVP
jgi:hypothetical protein